MKSAFRPVFLACMMVIATVYAPAAQLPPDRPNKVYVVLSRTDIEVENRVPSSPDEQKVWGRAGQTVQFSIENSDTVDHTVTIPLSVAEPKPGYAALATLFVPLVKGNESVTVPAQKDAVLTFNIASASDLQFKTRRPWANDPNKGMTYKYYIYSTPAGGNTIKLDPDIEIRP